MVSGPSRDNPDVILHDLYEPCAPRAPGAMEMNWTQVDGEKLKEPLVSLVSWHTLRVMTKSSQTYTFWVLCCFCARKMLKPQSCFPIYKIVCNKQGVFRSNLSSNSILSD